MLFLILNSLVADFYLVITGTMYYFILENTGFLAIWRMIFSLVLCREHFGFLVSASQQLCSAVLIWCCTSL